MKKSTVIIMWGVITAVVDAIYCQAFDIPDSPYRSLKFISYLIIFAGILVGTLQYRNKINGGYISYGEAYKTGILMTLIIAVILTISTAIFLHTHPDFQAKIMEQQRAAMVNKGMTSDQMNMAMGIAKKLATIPAISTFALIITIIGGAIMALLTSAISTKAKPIAPEEDTNITIA